MRLGEGHRRDDGGTLGLCLVPSESLIAPRATEHPFHVGSSAPGKAPWKGARAWPVGRRPPDLDALFDPTLEGVAH